MKLIKLLMINFYFIKEIVLYRQFWNHFMKDQLNVREEIYISIFFKFQEMSFFIS